MANIIKDPPIELKLEWLERLVRGLTGAKEIQYRKLHKMDNRVLLINVHIDNVRFVGAYNTNEYAGMVLDFEAEPCVIEPPSDEFFPANSATINAEIWFWTDPWKKIEDLEAELQSCKETVKEK